MAIDIEDLIFSSSYVLAIVVVILHYTGWLEDRNLNWLVFAVAVPTIAWPLGRLVHLW
ncbi:MAG: hypothetical protein AB7Q97_05730 [Gammaproteobacteria bacterium]